MFDFAIIGGGIVGLSVAWQLQAQYPDKRIVLLEKENQLASHQTGRNSGVIHAGIYYEPGSLKAQFCRAGVDATIAFCNDNEIPYEQCGKLIVATDDVEHERLLKLYERAGSNGLDVELLDAQELRKLEPNIVGNSAILLKTTGIVSYTQICEAMASRFQAAGGEILLNTAATGLSEDAEQIHIKRNAGDPLSTRFLIVCGGLQSDRLTQMMGIETDFRILPFRGEYYQLPEEKNTVVKHLIYPVPDPALPFLGVHLTRMIDGTVTVGPNALQAWKREGYGKLNFSFKDAWDNVSFPGFWLLIRKHFVSGLGELRDSLWKRGYLRRVQKYCPSISLTDLRPYPVGVRPQAVLKDGTMVHDFLFAESARSLHVCNAPSPAATSAIPIGEYICDLLKGKLEKA